MSDMLSLYLFFMSVFLCFCVFACSPQLIIMAPDISLGALYVFKRPIYF